MKVTGECAGRRGNAARPDGQEPAAPYSWA